MPDRHARIIDLVGQLYARTQAGDWSAAEAQLTDDFIAVEADHLPFAGTYSGKGALRTLFEKVMGMVDVSDMQIHAITASEEHAVALVDLVFARPENSRARIAEMFRFRGDLVCEIRPFYFDSAPVMAAVAAKRGTQAG